MMASPARVAASRAARHLGQELEGPLGRAEVGHAQPDISRDDADERHAREVVALGDHLRAHENVELAFTEPSQHGDQRTLPPDGVAVHARDARGRENAPPAAARPARSRSPRARDTGRRRRDRASAPRCAYPQ